MTAPKIQTRNIQFQREAVDPEARTVQLSVSSDTADVVRWVEGKGYGYEVLDHSSLKNIDLSRFAGANGGPLLLNHDDKSLVGRFVPSEVKAGRLYGTARLGRSALASEAFQDVEDNILVDCSIRYGYSEEDVEVDQTPGRPSDYPTYRIKNWQLYEVSLVSIPADATVGKGRSVEDASAPAEPAAVTETAPDPIAPAEVVPTVGTDTATPTQAEPRSATYGGPPMDTTPVAKAAQNDIAQAMSLRALADKLGKGLEAAEILSTKPLAEARELIINLVATQPLSDPQPYRSGGQIHKDMPRFSMGRALGLLAAGQKLDGVEAEVSAEVARSKGERIDGTRFFAPYCRSQFRAATTGAATHGAELVPTTQGDMIENLREACIAAQLGAQIIPGLRGNVSFPSVITPAAEWLGEAAEATGGDLVTGSVTLKPRTLRSLTPVSRTLLGTNPALESRIDFEMAQAHAVAIDAAIFGAGSGVTVPKGLYSLPGVLEVDFAGAVNYQDLCEMVGKAKMRSRRTARWAATDLLAARMMATLEFPDVNGSAKLWTGSIDDGIVCGSKAMSSGLLASNMGTGTNEHGLVYGDFTALLVGLFGDGFEVIVDNLSRAESNLVRFISLQEIDVAVQHGASFCRAKGLTVA